LSIASLCSSVSGGGIPVTAGAFRFFDDEAASSVIGAAPLFDAGACANPPAGAASGITVPGAMAPYGLVL